MSYKLESHETPAEGIKRIITEQIDKVIDSLEPPLDDADEAIHDARKRFKKIRGALRLVRDEIDSDVYKDENYFFRDLGRRLAPMRDSFVNLQTLDDILHIYSDELKPDGFEPLRDKLKRTWQETTQQTIQEEQAHKEIVQALHEAHDRIQRLPIDETSFHAFDEGLERVYKRGSKRLHKVYKKPEPEAFHEWRKCVKYLWYHMCILEPIWSDVVDEYGEAAHKLASHLGDAHDYAELQRIIREDNDLPIDDETERTLLAVLDAERAKLERGAWKLGQRIYAEDKKEFVARHSRYWAIWKAPEPERSQAVIELQT